MMRFIAGLVVGGIICLAGIAFGQSTETFSAYVKALPSAAALTGSEIIPVIQSNSAAQSTVSSIAGSAVSSGTINQLGYYAATGSKLSGLATCNNGFYLTNGSGVPSCSASIAFNPVLSTTSQSINMLGIGGGAGTNTWMGTTGNDTGGGGLNVFLGPGAGPHSDVNTYASSPSQGGENVAIGFVAGTQLTTGVGNEIIGGGAGDQVTAGSRNALIGRHAQRANHAGSDTVAIGEFANNGNDSPQVFGVFSFTGHVDNGSGGSGTLLTVTAISGTPLIVGMHVAGSGLQAYDCEIISLGTGTGGTGTYNLDCSGNTGSVAMTAALADLSQSVCVGTDACYSAADSVPTNPGNFSGNAVGIGYQAYQNGFTGQYNVAIGYQALKGDATNGVTGNSNIAIGHLACQGISTGIDNICIGEQSGNNIATANQNVYIGLQSGFHAGTSGGANTFIGYQAGFSVTTGNSNIIIGNDDFAGPGLTTGSHNVIIGNLSSGVATGLNNGIVFGDGQNNIRADYNATNSGGWTFTGGTYLPNIATDATKTDATVCEDTTTHQLYFGSGTAGICLGTSSLRFKHDVAVLDVGLRQIMDLQPISYKVNADHGNPDKTLYGFSAEQGGEVLPKLMEKDTLGQPNTFDYMGVVPVLVKAIQQQQAEIEELKAQLRQR